MKNIYVYATFFILNLITYASYAEESIDTIPAAEPVIETAPESTLLERAVYSIVHFRDKSSTHYMSLVRSIDQYFASDKYTESNNKSYVKIDLENTFYKAGEQTDGISINARIELPNTENRFKFIFSTDPEENQTLTEKIQGNSRGQRVDKTSSIAGIEYTPKTDQNEWEHNFSTGVKLRVNPIPFIRYNLGQKWQLNEAWRSSFRQSFWNYSDDGIGTTSTLKFGRPVTHKDYFSADTHAEFRDKDNRYYYGETFSNTHIYSKTSATRYWFGVIGESQPTSWVTDYVLGVQYRKTLYQDWLILSVNPQLNFPREQQWETTPSLTLNLQIYFKDKQSSP